jgi:threonine synthase
MTQATVKKARTFTHLVSKEGGVKYPLEALNVCEETFSPLEVAYDYDAIRAQVTRETIEAGPNSKIPLMLVQE